MRRVDIGHRRCAWLSHSRLRARLGHVGVRPGHTLRLRRCLAVWNLVVVAWGRGDATRSIHGLAHAAIGLVVILAIVLTIWVTTELLGHVIHLLLILSWVVGHAARLLCRHLLLMHNGGCDGRTSILAVRRVGMHAGRLKVGWHGATGRVGHGAELRLGGVSHLRVARLEITTTSAAVVAGLKLSVAHIAVCGLARLAAQVLALRD